MLDNLVNNSCFLAFEIDCKLDYLKYLVKKSVFTILYKVYIKTI